MKTIPVESYGATLDAIGEMGRIILVLMGSRRWKEGYRFVPIGMLRKLQEAHDTGRFTLEEVKAGLGKLQQLGLLTEENRPNFAIYQLTARGYNTLRVAWLKAEGDEDDFGQYLPLAARTRVPTPAPAPVRSAAPDPFATVAPLDGQRKLWGATP